MLPDIFADVQKGNDTAQYSFLLATFDFYNIFSAKLMLKMLLTVNCIPFKSPCTYLCQNQIGLILVQTNIKHKSIIISVFD